MMKVAITLEIPTPYRQPVLDQLAQWPNCTCQTFFLGRTQADRDWNAKDFVGCSAQYLKGFALCIPGRHTFRFNVGVHKALLAPHFDVHVIGGYAHPACLSIILHCWKRKIPYVLWTESHLRKPRSWIRQTLKRYFLTRVYRRAAAHLVASSAAREYVERYGGRPDATYLLPNTIDGPSYAHLVSCQKEESQKLRKDLGWDNRDIILFVGLLHANKGVWTLFRAFVNIAQSHPKATLLFAGDGPLKKALIAKICKASLSQRIHVAGFISPSKLPATYGASTLFVLPSYTETFGAVVCEAMAAGLPIVASRSIGAFGDFAKEDVNALGIEPGNVSELTMVMKRLLDDHALRSRMGTHSKNIMLGWTAQRCAQAFFSAVQSAAATGNLSCHNKVLFKTAT